MNSNPDPLPPDPRPTAPGLRELVRGWSDERLASELPREQARRWRRGERLPAEVYLGLVPARPGCDEVILDLIHNEYLLRVELGESPRVEEYLDRFPQYRRHLEAAFAFPMVPEVDSRREPETAPYAPTRGAPNVPEGRDEPLSWIGRYPVLSALGSGGFGVVYRARDEVLGREVAIKVPRGARPSPPKSVDAFLAEARVLAQLDHPGIVPVYDFGRMEDGRCFLVSKLVPGGALAERLATGPIPPGAAAGLVAAAAEALHHAHQRGLVHRDVKPGNILLEADGRPVVADFGLALREEDYGRGPAFAGTLAYMSPEQARGEGHLVDARTDVYSLGVVLYELLTGRRPFRSADPDELRELVKRGEPRPPRQLDDAVPRELDRICLKATSRRASDRYSTALDLATELREWEAGQRTGAPEPPRTPSGRSDPAAVGGPGGGASSVTDRVLDPIVPRGLRSFEPEDAGFFLDLLPGPRGRGGLPESVRFWKAFLEETDADRASRVGLIYGPSGCGKSSLVKAGLLPRLAAQVTALYVEATADDTEARLLKTLRRRFPDLPAGLGLADVLARLRRGDELADGSKLVLVIDQFEQWLHAHAAEAGEVLVEGLRQCDGSRVQALLLVRDDFWMAIGRFLRELEVSLLEGRNSAPVDLFAPRHARKVLAAFGSAFGELPEGRPAPEQGRFLDQCVAGLAEGGKVIPVRLALFAEMVKGKPWTPATWRDMGGAEGVGVAFLEETFAASTAPPHHRLHQQAARSVLKLLLPDFGADLKGPMRSREELLAASGYAGRPKEFDELLAILDGELRLVTATDRDATPATSPTNRSYQLSHDYLVPALRQWLTCKQRETRRGRAELRLAERAAAWTARPETRNLPSWWEWATIRLFTRKRDWTLPQRTLMRRAARYRAARAAVATAVLLLLGAVGWDYLAGVRARALRDRLLSASVSEVPAIVDEMGSHRQRLDPLLRADRERARVENDGAKLLRLSLALLPSDSGELDYLHERLLEARAEEFAIIRDQLTPHKGELVPRLWKDLADSTRDPDRRFRAACTLATYAPDDPRWPTLGPDVAGKLVAENAVVLGHWTAALRPLGRHLLPTLAEILKDERVEAAQRRTTAALYRAFAAGNDTAFAALERFTRDESADLPGDAKIARARQRANAAAALVAMDRGEGVWPLLAHGPDPTLRSYLIERLATGGAKPRTLEDRLAVEPDVTVRTALVLALGSFDEWTSSAEGKLIDLYENDPDPGVHGAADWALRRWKRQDAIAALDGRRASGRAESGRRWFVNKERQTFALVRPGRVEIDNAKGRRVVAVPYSFAVAAKEVTVREFQAFRPDHRYRATVSPTPDHPVNSVTWYEAAEYCNYLSRCDGIDPRQWCYRPNAANEYKEGMTIAPDYLQLQGYRLPTGEEWEFACRAGAVTRWSCGGPSGTATDNGLLTKYACYVYNSSPGAVRSTFPVGTLKPNDFGLFDMHGGVAEWCNGPIGTAPQHPEKPVSKDIARAIRGGDYAAFPTAMISEYEIGAPIWDPVGHIGVRPVKTVP